MTTEEFNQDVEVLRNLSGNKAILNDAIKHYKTLLLVFPEADAFKDTINYIRASNKLNGFPE